MSACQLVISFLLVSKTWRDASEIERTTDHESGSGEDERKLNRA